MSVKGDLRFIGVVEDANEQKAKIRIFPEFCAGLLGIEEFSHIVLLYWLNQRDNEDDRRTLLVFPRRHAVDFEVGVFACRSPSRPNPIGLCVVELVDVDGCTITVKGLDALQGSPVVDIKPYIPRADSVADARVPNWTHHGPST